MVYKSLTTTLQFHVKHCYICVLSSRPTEWQDNGRKIPFVSGKFQIYEQWANLSPTPFVESKQMKHVCRARIVWGRTETHVKVAERDFLPSVSSPHTQSSDLAPKCNRLFVNKHKQRGTADAYTRKNGASWNSLKHSARTRQWPNLKVNSRGTALFLEELTLPSTKCPAFYGITALTTATHWPLL